MKKRYIIYIVISILCVIAIIAGVYYQIHGSKEKTNKINTQNANGTTNTNAGTDNTNAEDIEVILEEFNSLFNNKFYSQGNDTTTIKRLDKFSEEEIVFPAYNFKEEKDQVYDVNINLPVINIYGDVAAELNNKTNEIFSNKAGEVLNNTSGKYIIYNVDYVAYLNGNILSVIIKSTLKEGTNAQRLIVQTYNYNVETNQIVSLNDVLDSYGIDRDTVNEKIQTQVKEADRQSQAVATALAEQGQNVYQRNLDYKIYDTDYVDYFFIGENGQIYVIYPYGNSNLTSEIDIIKI